jgi:hypothetical protein
LQQEQAAERAMLQLGVPCFFMRIIGEPQSDLLAYSTDHTLATATFSSHQVSTVGASMCAVSSLLNPPTSSSSDGRAYGRTSHRLSCALRSIRSMTGVPHALSIAHQLLLRHFFCRYPAVSGQGLIIHLSLGQSVSPAFMCNLSLLYPTSQNCSHSSICPLCSGQIASMRLNSVGSKAACSIVVLMLALVLLHADS